MEALLALIAIAVPASVTLVGYWMKRQSDRRLAQEAEQAEKRLAQQHSEERSRLRLDAAMRAADLFGVRGDALPNPASGASGLLALTQLDHADLAVVLLADLWSTDSGFEAAERVVTNGTAHVEDRPDRTRNTAGVSTETAVLVINAALQAAERPNAQLVAAELLCRNATRLDPCQSLHWPAAIDGSWLPGLSMRAKLLVLDGLIRMTCSRPANEGALRSIAVRLYGVWHGDSDNKRVQGCVGTLIDALLPALERLGYTEFLQGRWTVTLDQLRAAAASASPNPDGYLERILKEKSTTLGDWSQACSRCDLRHERLASAAN